jgi:hypothetical protein
LVDLWKKAGSVFGFSEMAAGGRAFLMKLGVYGFDTESLDTESLQIPPGSTDAVESKSRCLNLALVAILSERSETGDLPLSWSILAEGCVWHLSQQHT